MGSAPSVSNTCDRGELGVHSHAFGANSSGKLREPFRTLPRARLALIAMCEPVETHFLWRPQLRDPNNERVLEAAVNGRADAIVTFNRRDFGRRRNSEWNSYSRAKR